jgi:hypothetical protein
MSRKLQIGVIGYAGQEEYKNGRGGATKKLVRLAEEIGRLLAKEGVVVVTGGKSGIMEAVAKGAKSENGLTVGVVKGKKRFVANTFIDVEVISGMEADGLDELFVVFMSDALIVLGGGAGTLQEIAVAYRNNKPVVILQGTGGWADRVQNKFLDERKRMSFIFVKTAKEAVNEALKLSRK